MRSTALLAAALTAASAPANDFTGPIFAAPLRVAPGTTVPASGPLAAPVITPSGTTHHGKQMFELIPAGWDRDPFYTADPARYTTGACDDPIACSGGHCGGLGFDFLLMATRSAAAPPVVTTGPAALGFGAAAVPGQPGTYALLGGRRVHTEMRPGFRFEGSLPLTGDGRWGISTRVEVLGESADRLETIADGTAVVNVPQVFTIAGVPLQVPVYVGFPGLTVGTVTGRSQTNYLGGDVTLRRALTAGDAVRLDALVGYRVLHLGDQLESSWDVFSPTLPPPIGPRVMGEDSVRTRNDFHGLLLGLGSAARFGKWTVTGRAAVSLGGTSSERDQSRTRMSFTGTNGVTAAVGLPAIQVPLGTTAFADEASGFAVVPEANVKVGWRAAEYLHLTAGYSFTYWSRVRRAPEQYDLSGTLADRTTDFWAQGLSLGVEWRY